MEKGKLKNHKKYLSMLLIPHSSGNVQPVKIHAQYSRLIIAASFILMAALSIILLISYTIYENSRLRADISKFADIVSEQKSLLNDKADKIEELKKKDQNTSKLINDFRAEYKKISDDYISGKASRSGFGTERNFAADINTLKGILDKLDKTASSDDKALAGLEDSESKLKNYLDTVPTLLPTSGRISSKFGEREDPFNLGTKLHQGIDIAAPSGQNIKAAAGGTVIFAGTKGGYGNTVIISHGRGITTLYGHASKLVAKNGQTVKKGDIIAIVGSSGRSTGPHLHFEVRINDNPVDPLKYIEAK